MPAALWPTAVWSVVAVDLNALVVEPVAPALQRGYRSGPSLSANSPANPPAALNRTIEGHRVSRFSGSDVDDPGLQSIASVPDAGVDNAAQLRVYTLIPIVDSGPKAQSCRTAFNRLKRREGERPELF
jgi:hypothetical protein